MIQHTASSRIGQVEILAAKLLISALKMHNVWVVVYCCWVVITFALLNWIIIKPSSAGRKKLFPSIEPLGPIISKIG